MRTLRPLLFGLLVVASAAARGETSVEVCFNSGCASRATIVLGDERLDEVAALFADVVDAVAEREAISRAVAALYRIAGEQSPIRADRAGNFSDGGVDGRMDCIDHATTTTRFLVLIEARGWLRFHRVLEPARRWRLIFQHNSAVIEETEPAPRPPEESAGVAAVEPIAVAIPDHVPLLLALCDCDNVVGDIPRPREPTPGPVAAVAPVGMPGARFAVDSWFRDHGEPAVVLPLSEWMNGEGPDVH